MWREAGFAGSLVKGWVSASSMAFGLEGSGMVWIWHEFWSLISHTQGGCLDGR